MKFWEEQPPVREELEWIRRAFEELHTDRPVGMGGSGSIPWTSIDRYATRHGVRNFRRFVALVRALDDTWLEHQRRMNTPKKVGK